MSSSILIADASCPVAVSLSESLRAKGAAVGLLSGLTPLAESGLTWNRSSPLSARTVVLGMKNAFGPFDRAVLAFDAQSFSASASPDDATAPVRCVDEYARGYLLLALEIAKAFKERRSGLLAFALKPSPPQAVGANIPLAVAEGAFIRLAEEIAASFAAFRATGAERSRSPAAPDGPHALLARFESADDAESVSWLTEQLLAPMPQRLSARWVKAGARGLFGKF